MFFFLKKKAVWEAVLSLADLRGKLSQCSQPPQSRDVNSQGGGCLAVATFITTFSAEQTILCSSF